jgi:hypothetical protein
MCSRKIRLLAYICAFSISGCGTVSVQYREPIESATSAQTGSGPNNAVASIVHAAAIGNQTAVLPVSRLVVVGTPSQAQSSGQVSGAAQGDASPPPAQPAAAPTHGAAGGKGTAATTPKPAQIGTQPASQAADQAGGKQATKAADSTAPAPSVTSTFTSADGTVKYSVSVVQVESSVAFMVQPTNNFFSQNDFSISRLANTRIPTTVSNTFTDETASRIKAIASVAAAVIPLAAAAAPPHGPNVAPAAPQCLNEDLLVDDALVTVQGGSWTTRKLAWVVNSSLGGKCLDINLSADPLGPNLVPVSSLAAAFADKGGDWSKVWPVPACMTVHVVIKPQGAADGDGKAANGQLTVIDPDYVELMPIPKKGKIAMHPICGGDLADSATDPYQADFDTISALSSAFPAKKTSK